MQEYYGILPDFEIRELARDGVVKPFVNGNVNPASIDLTVSNEWRDLNNHTDIFVVDEVTIYPRTFFVDVYNFFARIFGVGRKVTTLMAVTKEWINIPNGMAAMVKLKSSLIREGLGYPIADWVDPGYSGKLTLVFTAYRKITLHKGQRVVQLVMERMKKCEHSYSLVGHYNNQREPTLARRENVI